MQSKSSTKSAVRVKGPYTITTLEPGLLEWEHKTGAKRWTLRQMVSGVRNDVTLKVENRTQAKLEAARLRGLIAGGETPIVPTKQTMSDLYALYIARWQEKVADGERSRRTMQLIEQRWAKYIGPVIGHVRTADLSKTHVALVISKAKKDGKSTSLQDSLLDIVSGLCRFGIERDLMKSNPARDLPRDDRPVVRHKRETYVLSDQEVGRIIASASPGWTTFFTLLAESGLRISEALGLTWDDVNDDHIKVVNQLDRGTAATLVPLKTVKSRREIPITAEMRLMLVEHKMASAHKGDDDLVFCSASGRSPGYTNASRAFKAALKRSKIDAGGKRLSPHGLRHAFGTKLLLSGRFPVEAVSRLMGHSTVAITQEVYSHTLEQMKKSGELQITFQAVMGGQA